MRRIAAEILAFDRAPIAIDRTLLAREILAFDKLTMRSYDVDNRLHVDLCNISKATVNPYYGREIPNGVALGLDPDKIYKLYRHPDELEKGAATFRNLQLLDLHTPVNADNPKMDRTCGTIGSDVVFVSPYLKASIAVWTAAGIALIQSKQAAQLSSSYRYTADMQTGVTPEGVAYDGVMRDIVGNHVALVREGRAGPDVCVSDSLPLELSQMAFKYARLIALVTPFLKSAANNDLLALDKALDKAAKDEDKEANDAFGREEACDTREEAMDSAEEAMDADPECKLDEKAKGDRKSARDKRASDRKMGKDKRAADKKARDAGTTGEPGPVGGPGGATTGSAGNDKAEDSVSRVEAQKMASDAAANAVRVVNDIATAKEVVKPLVGIVTAAFDSAEGVYRFALDQAKVPHAGKHADALPSIVEAEIKSRKVGVTAAPKIAADAAVSVSAALPSGRIRHLS